MIYRREDVNRLRTEKDEDRSDYIDSRFLLLTPALWETGLNSRSFTSRQTSRIAACQLRKPNNFTVEVLLLESERRQSNRVRLKGQLRKHVCTCDRQYCSVVDFFNIETIFKYEKWLNLLSVPVIMHKLYFSQSSSVESFVTNKNSSNAFRKAETANIK